MNQFDVCTNADRESRDRTPYLINLQADFLSSLATRAVAPVRPYHDHRESTVSRLHPIIAVAGTEYVAVVSELAAVPTELLGACVASAREYRIGLIAALDLLIVGF